MIDRLHERRGHIPLQCFVSIEFTAMLETARPSEDTRNRIGAGSFALGSADGARELLFGISSLLFDVPDNGV